MHTHAHKLLCNEVHYSVMVSRKAVLAGVGIGIAGSVGYLMYRAEKAQAQVSRPPSTGCGPYVPNSEKLTTDKASYSIGETLSWTAKNLQIGAQYNVVLATKDLSTWIVPNPFFATSCVKSGQIHLVRMMGGIDITPGQYTLILVKYTPGTQIMSSVSLTLS